MTTKLTFEAPIDLSVGRVRIADGAGEIARWTATPDNRVFAGNVEPGFYTAEISPAGVPPQSVIFEVHADQDNDVTAPSFSSLLASSGNMTFLNVSDAASAIGSLFGAVRPVNLSPATEENDALGPSANVRTDVMTGTAVNIDGPAEVAGAALAEPATDAAAPVAAARRLSVGLSIEGATKADSFKPFAGRAKIEVSESRLVLVVAGPDDWSPLSGERVRLSVAIEGVRVERLLLPMYRGGVQITISPSPLSASDVELGVLPNDARLRALVRALIAGTALEAEAVRSLVRDTDALTTADRIVDPWEAILSALLSIRFPDEMPILTAALADGLAMLAPWAYDSHVIRARQLLYSTTAETGRAAAAAAALDMLRKAQMCGSPYFSYVNQLFAEMIEALHGYFGRTGPKRLRKSAARIRDRWLREQALQSSAGASFSWLRRDQTLLKQGILAPDRKPTGQLGASATTLFAGHIDRGRIRLKPAQTVQPTNESLETPSTGIAFGVAPADCPANARPPGPVDDPNRGRFGGLDAVDGYGIRTHFDGEADAGVVTITMIVGSDGTIPVAPREVAWFCLHPTFDPQWIKVMFGNGRAVLSVQTLGGFTVGVWIPGANIELESDLSQLPNAPKIVREC